MRFAFIAMAVVAAVVAAAEDEVEHVWVREGGEVELVCRAEHDLTSCELETAYGKVYSMSKEAREDRNRLERIGGLGQKMCGFKVTNVEDKDFGEWRCDMKTEPDDEVVGSSKRFNVTKNAAAVKNVTLDSADGPNEFKCVADGEGPDTPVFEWSMDFERIEKPAVKTWENATSEAGREWVQTITLESEESRNATLTCTVGDFSDSLNITLVDDKECDFTQYVIGCVAAAVFVIALVVICVKMIVTYGAAFEVPRKDDVEAGQDNGDAQVDGDHGKDKPEANGDKVGANGDKPEVNGDKPEANGSKSDAAQENGDVSKTTEEDNKKGFGERFASFFRMNKTKEEVDDVAKEVIDGQEAKGKFWRLFKVGGSAKKEDLKLEEKSSDENADDTPEDKGDVSEPKSPKNTTV